MKMELGYFWYVENLKFKDKEIEMPGVKYRYLRNYPLPTIPVQRYRRRFLSTMFSSGLNVDLF